MTTKTKLRRKAKKFLESVAFRLYSSNDKKEKDDGDDNNDDDKQWVERFRLLVSHLEKDSAIRVEIESDLDQYFQIFKSSSDDIRIQFNNNEKNSTNALDVNHLQSILGVGPKVISNKLSDWMNKRVFTDPDLEEIAAFLLSHPLDLNKDIDDMKFFCRKLIRLLSVSSSILSSNTICIILGLCLSMDIVSPHCCSAILSPRSRSDCCVSMGFLHLFCTAGSRSIDATKILMDQYMSMSDDDDDVLATISLLLVFCRLWDDKEVSKKISSLLRQRMSNDPHHHQRIVDILCTCDDVVDEDEEKFRRLDVQELLKKISSCPDIRRIVSNLVTKLLFVVGRRNTSSIITTTDTDIDIEKDNQEEEEEEELLSFQIDTNPSSSSSGHEDVVIGLDTTITTTTSKEKRGRKRKGELEVPINKQEEEEEKEEKIVKKGRNKKQQQIKEDNNEIIQQQQEEEEVFEVPKRGRKKKKNQEDEEVQEKEEDDEVPKEEEVEVPKRRGRPKKG